MKTRLFALAAVIFGFATPASAQTVQCDSVPSVLCTCAQNGVPSSVACSGVLPDTGTVVSTARMPGGQCPSTPQITGVEVGLQMNHSAIGDLSATITSPAGKTATLFYRPGITDTTTGWTSEDINANFSDYGTPLEDAGPFLIPGLTGEVQSLDALTLFDGDLRSGVWTLTVTDNGHIGYGGLLSWSLNLPCNLPTVVVQAPDSVLQAGTDYPHAFVISRYGSTQDALVVNLQILGTAVPGVDYVTLPTSITIPAGASEAVLDVMPATGAPPQILKDLVVVVAPGQYIVGDLALARVELIDCSQTACGGGSSNTTSGSSAGGSTSTTGGGATSTGGGTSSTGGSKGCSSTDPSMGVTLLLAAIACLRRLSLPKTRLNHWL